MSGPPPPPPLRGSMSLYANLLDPSSDSAASISRDPKQSADGSTNAPPAKKPIDPALLLQPIIRPQAKQTGNKIKIGLLPKTLIPTAAAAPAVSAASASSGTTAAGSNTTAAPSQRTLADWTATENDDSFYAAAAAEEKRARGGRRKKKKKLDENGSAETNWDDIYDPARPTNMEQYLRSDERIREVQDWKKVLYAHRRRERRSASYSSEMNSDDEEDAGHRGRQLENQFAPPVSLTFAPPPLSPPRRPSPALVAKAMLEDATGDDAYARRLALSGMAKPLGPPAVSQPPAPVDAATISRAPVRYQVPAGPQPPSDDDAMDLDDDDDDEVNYNAIPPPPPPPPPPARRGSDSGNSAERDGDAQPARSSRPGQAGFAKRFMVKYGWKDGLGLGADEGGMTSALRVQVEKQKRRPDSEGGGFVGPGGRGKIIAAKNAQPKKKDEDTAFGKTSQVIVLRNMLEGMPDLAHEIEAGLGQEIGEECGEKYGRVERLFIDRADRQVFIKFTDQVSALRAVNALQGRIFNGNAIVAKFFDADSFENGVYK